MIDASMPNQTRDADVPDIVGFLRRIATNILAGARVAYFRPFSGREFNVGAWHIFVLVVIDVCIAVAYDYVSIEPDRYFSMYGFMHAATAYLLLVFAVFVLTSIQSDQGGTPRLLVIIFATLPAVSVVLLPIAYAYVHSEHHSLVTGWLIWLVWLAWGLAIVYRVLNNRYSIPRRRVVALVAIYALLSMMPQLFLQDVQFWYSYNLEDYAKDEKKETVNIEKVYYAQQGLLKDTAGNLAAHRPGVTDLYFVGFGSYASQDVFMNEVQYVRNLFDTHFDTRGRSVALINNAKTVHDVPLANASNLRIILKKIASRMDTEEDVLFLFLTSHGSKDAVLSVNFLPIDPNDLSAQELSDILAESEIKWRILVVSACYSGSFIESLKNDDTLILTASHKNKTSFGCSNDRELTYFGEHFFARELQEGGSFVEAFHRAKGTLREREISESVEPSDPQIFIGAGMERKLEELQERFRASAPKMARLSGATSRHCYRRSGLALEGLSTVHGEHIVESQEVACLPETDDLRDLAR